jgi:hypothetical protein
MPKILIRPLTDGYDCSWIGIPFRKNFTDIIGRKSQIYDRYEYWYSPTKTFWQQVKNINDFEYGIEGKDGLVYIKSYQEVSPSDKIINENKNFTLIEGYSEEDKDNEYRTIVMKSIKNKLK